MRHISFEVISILTYFSRILKSYHVKYNMKAMFQHVIFNTNVFPNLHFVANNLNPNILLKFLDICMKQSKSFTTVNKIVPLNMEICHVEDTITL